MKVTLPSQTCKKPAVYEPRKPHKTVLYKVMQRHIETWVKQNQENTPFFVQNDLRQYLTCGILAYGFARAHCKGCGHDFLVGYSCKGRGICPSCNTKRMNGVAAHVVENVIPKVPIRQFVLSFTKRLRPYLQNDPELNNRAIRLVMSVIDKTLKRCSPGAPTRKPPFSSLSGLT